MEIQEREYVYIQSYKHDGSLHRTWAKGYVIEANERRIVAVTNKTLVSEADGRKWVTREPAICFFYPDKWYNVICMIRKSGIHYYCNLASPSLYDGEAIKNIDEEDDRFHKLLNTLFYICKIADFEIEGRIVLKDKKTGKTWR